MRQSITTGPRHGERARITPAAERYTDHPDYRKEWKP